MDLDATIDRLLIQGSTAPVVRDTLNGLMMEAQQAWLAAQEVK